MRTSLRFLLFGLLAATLAPPAPIPAAEEGGPQYTAYNTWYERRERMQSTNYSDGILLPAGTQVTAVRLSRGKLSFIAVDSSEKFVVDFVGRHHPGVSADEFRERFITPKNFSALTKGFSKQEIEAIKAGEVRKGMSKKAVLVARGYPPETKTPSTEMNTWVYWHSRPRSYEVTFVNGKVVRSEY